MEEIEVEDREAVSVPEGQAGEPLLSDSLGPPSNMPALPGSSFVPTLFTYTAFTVLLPTLLILSYFSANNFCSGDYSKHMFGVVYTYSILYSVYY